MMLADGCEAALRSLPPDTSEQEARNTVKRIVEARISDGQLAQSSLSRAELELVMHSLCGCGDGCVTAASLSDSCQATVLRLSPAGELRPDPHTPLAVEIRETQRERMQPHRPRTAAAKEAVDGIANNRCSHRSEMGPQLMGTAGERAQPRRVTPAIWACRLQSVQQGLPSGCGP